MYNRNINDEKEKLSIISAYFADNVHNDVRFVYSGIVLCKS